MSSLRNSLAPKVFLSPFVLSTVMLDNSNCVGDQEGFLIGRSYKSVRFEINDQSMCNTEEDLMISVFSAFPCGNFLSFYDTKGVINVDFIKNFLGDRIKSVIGWYRFRRNIPPYPSAREAIVHRNLMRAFSGNLAIGDNFFIYGVFGSSASESGATHTYDYAFYVERPDRFVPLIMSMLNLIDTKTKYRSGSLASSFVNSQTFDSVLNIAWSFESCWQTEDGIQQMHKLLRDKCSNLSEELTASESVNATIEEDVVRLEAELESLNMAEEQLAELDDSLDANSDGENAENIPPDEESIDKPSRKRYWSEVIDFENEKRHTVYGKYFEQNKAPDPENKSQEPSETAESVSVPPPPKKFKVLEEQEQVSDRYSSSESDDDSDKYDEDEFEKYTGSSFTSEVEENDDFEQNKAQDTEIRTQESSEAAENVYYVLPPQKKFKILQEHKRVIDHDYSSASDDDSHKYVQDIEVQIDDGDGTSLISEAEDCTSNDGAVSVMTENIVIKEECETHVIPLEYQEEEVKTIIEHTDKDNDSNASSTLQIAIEESLKTGNGNNNANISGYESPLESSSSGRPHIIYCIPADKEEVSDVSQREK